MWPTICLVSTVDTVEDPDRHHRAAPARRAPRPLPRQRCTASRSLSPAGATAGASTTCGAGPAVAFGHDRQDRAVRTEDRVRPGEADRRQRTAVESTRACSASTSRRGKHRGGRGVERMRRPGRPAPASSSRVDASARVNPPTAGTAQRGEVPADPQRRPEVAGDGPDVGAGGTGHLDVDVDDVRRRPRPRRPAPVDVDAVHRTGRAGSVDRLARADPGVRPDAR